LQRHFLALAIRPYLLYIIKMKIGKLILKWWCQVLLVLIAAIILYAIWHSQQNVNAIEKELHRTKTNH